jgi:hypothetical protein
MLVPPEAESCSREGFFESKGRGYDELGPAEVPEALLEGLLLGFLLKSA